MQSLVVILAIAAIAAVMTAVDVVAEKNANGGNSGKIKTAVTNAMIAVDAVAIPDVVAVVTNVIAIAATKNLPNRNFYLN